MTKYLNILLMIACIGCQQNTKESSEDLQYKKFDLSERNEDSIQTIIGMVSPNDDNCMFEIKMAKDSIEHNRLTYYVGYDPVTCGRYRDDLEILLKPLGIKCGRPWGSCLPLIDSRDGCYFDYMNTYIEQKFKKWVIDSLKAEAIKIYAEKNIDNVAAYIGNDSPALFFPKSKSYASQPEDIDKDFKKNFQYPKNFFTDGSGTYLWRARVHLLIHRDGKTEVTVSEIEFENEKNKIHEQYFKDKIQDYAVRKKWLRYNLNGLIIDSETFFELKGSRQDVIYRIREVISCE